MNIGLKDIGGRIRKVREGMGLSQIEFGNLIGVKGPTISNYEKGETDAGSIPLAKIAEIGKVSLDWLIVGKKQGGIETGGMINENTAKYGTDNQRKIWLDIIGTVEQILQDEGFDLPPENKVKLCDLVFRDYYDGNSVNKEKLARILHAVK